MITRPGYKKVATPIALKLQRKLGLFPHNLCLISGAPRSGTSALCDWLKHQRTVSAFPESRILISAHSFMEEAFRFKSLKKDSARMAKLARQLVFEYYSGSRILAGRKLVVDKEPLEPIAFPEKEYGQFIANVKSMVPDLKLLFAIRDPIATIWSMSRRTWGESLVKDEARRFTLAEYAENWNACAELALLYHSDPNVYVVQFGNLIHDSEAESERIFKFLDIHSGIPFQPKKTNEIGFGDDERRRILQMVQPQLEKLRARKITNLA